MSLIDSSALPDSTKSLPPRSRSWSQNLSQLLCTEGLLHCNRSFSMWNLRCGFVRTVVGKKLSTLPPISLERELAEVKVSWCTGNDIAIITQTRHNALPHR